jgi:hypothetical protein
LLEQFDWAVIKGTKKAAEDAGEQMVNLTKASAPARKGKYRSAITKEITDETQRGITVTWGVKGKKGNLSHLLERGHVTRNGRRTRAFGFIADALEPTEKKYLKDIEKAVQDAAK